jgi:hypothetical protein
MYANGRHAQAAKFCFYLVDVFDIAAEHQHAAPAELLHYLNNRLDVAGRQLDRARRLFL